jgi:hypothetical protein
MDFDAKHLLWFGGEQLTGQVPMRRVHSMLMAKLWQGWTIRWASEGVADIARYLGRPVASVLSDRQYNLVNPSQLHPVGASAPNANIVTFRINGNVHLFKFLLSADRLSYGAGCDVVARLKSLIDEAPVWDGFISSSYIWSGMVVDVECRSLDIWTSTDFPDALGRLSSKWPGWAIRWHEDRMEAQTIKSEGRLRPLLQSRNEMLAELRDWLLWPDTDKSGAETAFEVGKLLSGMNDVTQVRINPAALHDAQLELPLEVRTDLFDSAVAAMNG